MSEALAVRLSGVEVGELDHDGRFRWVDGWEGWAPLNSAVLSNSLPFGADGGDPAPFFGGLLPEGIGLDRLAREARVASNDLFGLLAEVGADVGGSVTVGEPRPPVPPIEIEEQDFAGILDRAYGYFRGRAVGGGGSAATGVQQKVALTRDDPTGRWLIGRGSTPSTHLLKPVPAEFDARVRAEAFMNRLARELGLAQHRASVESAGARSVLVVERYDRRKLDDGTIERIHQEDCAQALRLPWGGNDKYENVNDRASLRNIAALLDRGRSLFDSGPSDRERLLAATVLNVVAGNTDAHAKNFSVMLPPLADPTAAATLADIYDVVPQLLFSAEAEPLAMRIAGSSDANGVTGEHLMAEATGWGMAPTRAEAVIAATCESIVEVLARIGDDEPGAAPAAGTRSVASTAHESARLRSYLRERAENLLRGDEAWTRRLPPALALR